MAAGAFIYLTLQAQRNGARGEKENGAVGYILAVAKRNGLNLKPCGVGRGGGGFKLPLPRHAASTRGTTGRKRRRQAALCFTALAQVFLAAAPEHAETSQTLECSPDFFFSYLLPEKNLDAKDIKRGFELSALLGAKTRFRTQRCFIF